MANRKSVDELQLIQNSLAAEGLGGDADRTLAEYEKQLGDERANHMKALSDQVTYMSTKGAGVTVQDRRIEAAHHNNIGEVTNEQQLLCAAIRVATKTTGLPNQTDVGPGQNIPDVFHDDGTPKAQ